MASLLPYIFVAFSIDYSDDNQIRNFYGDGSILMLCVGIMLSYFTAFLGFKTNKNLGDSEHKDINDDNNLINGILLLVYIISVIQFYLCQTSSRDWSMIVKVIFGSSFLFIFTLATAAYLHFREEISFAEVQSYEDSRKMQKLKKDSESTDKTDDGTKL